jgi:hypothetical protein
VNRVLVSVGACLACLLLGAFTAACGEQSTDSGASDPAAGHRAQLVSLGGVRLSADREQQVTFRADAGTLKIIAEVGGPIVALECTLSRLDGEGSTVKEVAVPLTSHSTSADEGAVFTLRSATLQAGTYRLTYTGRGSLGSLGVGTGY